MTLSALPPWVLVFAYALFTALATGLGALPFLFFREVSPRAVALSNAIAAGLMLGACFGLVEEGTHFGHWQTIVGGIGGLLFVLVAERALADREAIPGSEEGRGARRMVLMVAVMTVHSVAEGIAVGASFGGGMTLATVITLAIAVHNVPEGVAITAVLRPQGKSLAACAGWSIFSSLPQPLLAVPAFLFVDAFQPTLPYGIGFAAGAMVLMVFLELLPEAFEAAPRALVGVLASAALVAMVLFQRHL